MRAQVAEARRVDRAAATKTASGAHETGLVYYGRRYLNPRDGRFLGRDPIAEAGGLNLYGFCLNDAINRWDYLGMNPYLDKLQQEATALEGEIGDYQGRISTLEASVDAGADDEARRYRELVSQKQQELDAINSSISKYGGTYTVGSDGSTGLYVDLNGVVGPVAFNSPTIIEWGAGWNRDGVDPDTGQRWTIFRENQGLQDMTLTFTPLVGPGGIAATVGNITGVPINSIIPNKPGSLGKFKGTDALRAENKMARDAANAAGLTKDQASRLLKKSATPRSCGSS
jgi:RHS repeat-associated protein